MKPITINLLCQMFILLYKCWSCGMLRKSEYFYKDKNNENYEVCISCCDEIEHEQCGNCGKVEHKDNIKNASCRKYYKRKFKKCDRCDEYKERNSNFQKLPDNYIANICNECLANNNEKWCHSCDDIVDEDEYFDEFHECMDCYEKYKDRLDHTHPEIAKQFHPTLNGNKKPRDFTYGSHVEIWWICDKNPCGHGCQHIWKVKICDRTSRKGTSCPYAGCCKSSKKHCYHYSLAYLYPEIAAQWLKKDNLHIIDKDTREVLGPENFTPRSKQKVVFTCPNICKCGEYHKYETTISNRTKGSNCKFCYGSDCHCFESSFAGKFPHLKEEFDISKNGENMLYKPGSNEKFWWKCDKTFDCGCPHEWEALLSSRTNGSNCPFCAHKKLCCEKQSLFYLEPELMKEWDYEENKKIGLDPKNKFRGSDKEAFWKCKEGHRWKTAINYRTGQIRSGCPGCKNKTETKVLEFLKQKYTDDMESQVKFDWCKNITHLPFDFVIKSLKIIIEVDGRQHFHQVSNWKSPKETQQNDFYKMKCAANKGYKIIRIFQEDILYDKIPYGWNNVLEAIISQIKNEKKYKYYLSRSK